MLLLLLIITVRSILGAQPACETSHENKKEVSSVRSSKSHGRNPNGKKVAPPPPPLRWILNAETRTLVYTSNWYLYRYLPLFPRKSSRSLPLG